MPQIELLAEAASRLDAERALVAAQGIASAVAGLFGSDGARAWREYQDSLLATARGEQPQSKDQIANCRALASRLQQNRKGTATARKVTKH